MILQIILNASMLIAYIKVRCLRTTWKLAFVGVERLLQKISIRLNYFWLSQVWSWTLVVVTDIYLVTEFSSRLHLITHSVIFCVYDTVKDTYIICLRNNRWFQCRSTVRTLESPFKFALINPSTGASMPSADRKRAISTLSIAICSGWISRWAGKIVTLKVW